MTWLVRSVITVTVIAVVIIFVIIDVAVMVFMGKVVLSCIIVLFLLSSSRRQTKTAGSCTSSYTSTKRSDLSNSLFDRAAIKRKREREKTASSRG